MNEEDFEDSYFEGTIIPSDPNSFKINTNEQ